MFVIIQEIDLYVNAFDMITLVLIGFPFGYCFEVGNRNTINIM